MKLYNFSIDNGNIILILLNTILIHRFGYFQNRKPKLFVLDCGMQNLATGLCVQKAVEVMIVLLQLFVILLNGN